MASLNPLQGNLGTRSAKHLLRRTTFKIDRARIDSFAGKTASAAVDELLTVAPLVNSQPVDSDITAGGMTWIDPPNTLAPNIVNNKDFANRFPWASWWMNEARLDASIGHKMELFFHQNFITTITTSQVANYHDYMKLIRLYSTGNVKKLALKMITDNVMLRYLNNNTNQKSSPNENFAREFMELFTIQKGEQAGVGDYTTYTEADVAAAAKVLTGWRTGARTWDAATNKYINQVDTETGIPRGYFTLTRHDTTNKTFSARFGNKVITGATTAAGIDAEVLAFVTMIFDQDATAKSYVRRLYRYFVSRFIDAEIETDIIVPLAADLKANGYDLKPILKKLLASQHFFEKDDANANDEIVGGAIKSPLDIILPTLNFFNVTLPVPPDTTNIATNKHYSFYTSFVHQTCLGLAGFDLFYASDVAGYPGFYQDPDYARQWFNSSTIIARYKVGESLVTGKNALKNNQAIPGAVKLNLAAWLKASTNFTNKNDAEAVVQQFLEYLLCETVDSVRFNYFLNDVFADGLPIGNWAGYWQTYFAGGVDTEVNGWLNRLLTGIMYSPEFQVM